MISAQELERYSDVQLREHIEEHRGAIYVHDPERLSNIILERALSLPRQDHRFTAEALADALSHIESGQSRFLAREYPVSEAESLSGEELNEFDRQTLLRQEEQAYSDLKADGGRPWCSLAYLETVSQDNLKDQNQEMHAATLRMWRRPWAEVYRISNPSWDVFTQQIFSWRTFRDWQKRLREASARHATDSGKNPLLYQSRRLGELLEKRGLGNSCAVNLKWEPKEQDRLTTWLEYLRAETLRLPANKESTQEWLNWIQAQIPVIQEEMQADKTESRHEESSPLPKGGEGTAGLPQHASDSEELAPVSRFQRLSRAAQRALHGHRGTRRQKKKLEVDSTWHASIFTVIGVHSLRQRRTQAQKPR